MIVNSTTPAGPATSRADQLPGTPENKANTDGLGRDAFLRLLVTQLQHQDPTKPQADGEFLAQLAQFSALEKLSEIADSIQRLEGLLAEFRLSAAKLSGGSDSWQ